MFAEGVQRSTFENVKRLELLEIEFQIYMAKKQGRDAGLLELQWSEVNATFEETAGYRLMKGVEDAVNMYVGRGPNARGRSKPSRVRTRRQQEYVSTNDATDKVRPPDKMPPQPRLPPYVEGTPPRIKPKPDRQLVNPPLGEDRSPSDRSSPSRLVDVDISKVRISQTLETNAEMRTVRGLRQSLKDGYKTDLSFDDHIHIYRHEGVDYLVNGHHRKAAAELNGNTNLKAIYITTEELADVYGVTPSELVKLSEEANRIGNRIRGY